jgi:superfamily II RNA helicase
MKYRKKKQPGTGISRPTPESGRKATRVSRLSPRLRKILNDIGMPETAPFVPDPFQLESLEKLSRGDVLVSAPTGSGKTWIAIRAIEDCMGRGKKTWYASPLKALSNSKFEEFSSLFGSENVGILTGDRKENPDAPIIVGTTEILRNQLYDAMHRLYSLPVELVVLDEVHFLSDPDRGVVWEEVLIYLPMSVRLLLLSATVSNATEISRWLEAVRQRRCAVVSTTHRPVPLHLLFLFPSGKITLFTKNGRLNPHVRTFTAKYRSRRTKGINVRLDLEWILEQLRYWNLTPAIFFLKSRADCDRAVEMCGRKDLSQSKNRGMTGDIREMTELYPHLENHRQLPCLLNGKVASHHAGQLPRWKALIEKMMQKGHIDAIFSTSTIAAGVNFPARSVVLIQSDRYDGREFKELTATELHQMLGRAGRRGKDRVGFGLIAPGLYIDPYLIHELKDSAPDPINSQIQINFSMVLNLLLSHNPEGIRELLEYSLATFQEKGTHPELETEWENLLSILRTINPKGKCDWENPRALIDLSRKRRTLIREITHLTGIVRRERIHNFLLANLKPGRVFQNRRKELYICMKLVKRRGKTYCAAQKVTPAHKTRGKKVKWKKVPLSRIGLLFDYQIDIPEDYSPGHIDSLLNASSLKNLSPLPMEENHASSHVHDLEIAQRELENLPCTHCEYREECSAVESGGVKSIFARIRELGMELEKVRHRLWEDFDRHLRFLRETGFVDTRNTLTTDGLWAAKLRVDQPLLIAECIRKGTFLGVTARMLSALVAPFVLDRSREVKLDSSTRQKCFRVRKSLSSTLNAIESLRRHQLRRGFDAPPLEEWPAYAMYLWAGQCTWEKLSESIPVEEGDLASLILRTADHLRQIASLDKSHPRLSETARRSILLILREPVLT